MLQLLSLKDFVIVPSLVIEASSGLTCLTGETGAGKSILIDALELVLGSRSDIGLIREGAQRTEVCAEFDVTPRVKKWLSAAGLDESDTVILRRTVDIKGRSRAWINATPVTVSQIRELGERLVDIHGQHAHQSLLKTSYQLQLVDGFGSTQPLRLAVREAWLDWQERLRLLNQATQDTERLQAEAERLGWINELLDELDPRPGQWEELSNEHSLLSNGAEIMGHIRAAADALSSGEETAVGLTSQAAAELSAAAKFDPELSQYEESLSEAIAVLEDISRDISHHLDEFNVDESRFAEIDERLSLYWKLSKKLHRAPEELSAYREEVKSRLHEITENADIDMLQEHEARAREVFMKRAAALSQARQKAAQALSEAVTAQMQRLAMTGGRLEITLPASEPWAGGLERCEFLVSGHAGATPRALTKVASGGELARISLAIAVITAQITPVPTLIFDEVDSGIGGAVAEVVGHLLRRLGATRQVLCVTHLPQVAACAHHQWLVQKHTLDNVTTSSLKPLTEEERIREIARMAGGLQITEATLKSAQELIESAKQNDNVACDEPQRATGRHESRPCASQKSVVDHLH